MINNAKSYIKTRIARLHKHETRKESSICTNGHRVYGTNNERL